MIGGDAILETVRPAGVLGHVAADGARRLAGRIGHVLQSERRGGLGEARIDHARLQDGAAPHRVQLEDAIQAGQGDQHRVAAGDRATGEAGAGAPRHERDAEAVEQPDTSRTSRRRPGITTTPGKDSRVGQAVHRVGGELGAPVAHPPGADDPGECRDHLGGHGGHAWKIVAVG